MDHDEKIVDFDALERELQAAIESDVKYWRENDAKMRAIDQRVETYDQFRDMVKTAHLKPMDRKEIQKKLQNDRNSIWNTVISKNRPVYSTPTAQFTKKQEDIRVIPTTGVEFSKQWRNLQPSNRLQYLRNVGVHNMKQLFMSEIPVEVFGGILEVASQSVLTDASSFAFCIRLLQTLTQINKFALNLQFLSSTERTAYGELIDKLDSNFLKYKELLQDDGLTEETLVDLRIKYDLNDKKY